MLGELQCSPAFVSLLKTSGGHKAVAQGNGDLAAEVASSNGYTCQDCRMLSARTDALTAHSAIHGTTSRVYSRDRVLKPRKSSASVVSKEADPAPPPLVNLWAKDGLMTQCLPSTCQALCSVPAQALVSCTVCSQS